MIVGLNEILRGGKKKKRKTGAPAKERERKYERRPKLEIFRTICELVLIQGNVPALLLPCALGAMRIPLAIAAVGLTVEESGIEMGVLVREAPLVSCFKVNMRPRI